MHLEKIGFKEFLLVWRASYQAARFPKDISFFSFSSPPPFFCTFTSVEKLEKQLKFPRKASKILSSSPLTSPDLLSRLSHHPLYSQAVQTAWSFLNVTDSSASIPLFPLFPLHGTLFPIVLCDEYPIIFQNSAHKSLLCEASQQPSLSTDQCHSHQVRSVTPTFMLHICTLNKLILAPAALYCPPSSSTLNCQGLDPSSSIWELSDLWQETCMFGILWHLAHHKHYKW